MSYRDKAEEAQRKNIEEFMEHGPGLRKSTRIFYVARCPSGRHVLKGGLGGMGVGQMWSWTREYGRSDGAMSPDLAEAWDELPISRCCNFGINDACTDEETTSLVLQNVLEETKTR
jgi:hypothetical protein